MRINVNNQTLPGIQSERTITMGSELRRDAIFTDGEYVGEIVYTSRRTSAGTDYGWRPAKAAPQSSLTTKGEAITRLPRLAVRAA